MAIPQRFWNISISICLIFIAIVFNAGAQKPEFGIFAGPQSSFAKYKVEGTDQKTSNKWGFQAGAGLKVPFEAKLYFSPALFYSLKGYKVKFTDYTYPPGPLASDNNTTIHTIEVALLLQYDVGSNPDHFFIKAGPSFDLQISGKEEFNLLAGGSVKRKMPYSFGDYGRYAVSLLTQIGYETSGGFMIFGHFNLGLTSINNADHGPKIFHRTLGISVGKYFNNKKIVLDTRNKE